MDLQTATESILASYRIPYASTPEEARDRAMRKAAEYLNEDKRPTEQRLLSWIQRNTNWPTFEAEAEAAYRRAHTSGPSRLSLVLRNRRGG